MSKINIHLHRICDSLPLKILARVCTLITVCTILIGLATHKQSAHAPIDASKPPASATGPQKSSVTQAAAVAHLPAGPVGQTSHEPESPNINGVKRDVRVNYGPSTAAEPRTAQEKASAVVPPPTVPPGSVTQVSYGAQSPNITAVGGNVDIQYGPAARRSEKPGEISR
jgi:hypothetical protein